MPRWQWQSRAERQKPEALKGCSLPGPELGKIGGRAEAARAWAGSAACRCTQSAASNPLAWCAAAWGALGRGNHWFAASSPSVWLVAGGSGWVVGRGDCREPMTSCAAAPHFLVQNTGG